MQTTVTASATDPTISQAATASTSTNMTHQSGPNNITLAVTLLSPVLAQAILTDKIKLKVLRPSQLSQQQLAWRVAQCHYRRRT